MKFCRVLCESYHLFRIRLVSCSDIPARMPYAVAKGRNPGIYNTWSECEKEVKSFSGAVFKKFATVEDAKKFIEERTSQIIDKRKESSTDISKAGSKGTKRRLSESDSDDHKKTKVVDGFVVNEDGILQVYTDGACSFNGKHGAQAGIGIYFGEDSPKNVSEPVNGRATNNTAEIQAATMALKVAKENGFTKVQVNTDSQFMINCVTQWMKKWKKNGWKKSSGQPVINKADLEELDNISEGLMVKWNHVPGHAGHLGNERADKLAREGALRYKSDKS